MNKSSSPETAQIPTYLRIKTYCVTTTLKGKLASYPPDFQEKLCFIQSLVITLARKNRHPGLFTNISAKAFDNKCRDYRKFIDILIAEGELQVNENYSADKHFTKSYRIPLDKRNVGFTTESFRKKRVRAEQDKSNVQSANVTHQKKCLSQLRVRADFLSTGSLTRDIVAKTALQRIAQGIGNFREGRNSKRISNTILQVPRDARANIVHKDGADIYEYDIHACHPFLLIGWCNDATEREAYGALISDKRTDIYSYIGREMRSGLGRDELKIEMLRFINGGGHNIFDEYFKRDFPALHKEVRAGGKANALRLQNIEAEIMAALGDWCASQHLYFISQNDGFVAKRGEAEGIIGHLKELIHGKFGYYPNIDIKDRFSNTSNDNKKTLPSLSYLLHKDNPCEAPKKKRVVPPWVWAKRRKDWQEKWKDPTFRADWRKRNCFFAQDTVPSKEDVL